MRRDKFAVRKVKNVQEGVLCFNQQMRNRC